MSLAAFQRKRQQFLIDSHHSKLQEKHVKLLSQCRHDLIVDPILKIPMTRSEWSRCVRWRLGWLPLGKPQICPFHPNVPFTRSHSFSCLDMHNRLQMPKSILDPYHSFWIAFPDVHYQKSQQFYWCLAYSLAVHLCFLHEMDYLAHSQFPDASDHLGEPFITFLRSIQKKSFR